MWTTFFANTHYKDNKQTQQLIQQPKPSIYKRWFPTAFHYFGQGRFGLK